MDSYSVILNPYNIFSLFTLKSGYICVVIYKYIIGILNDFLAAAMPQ